MLEFIAVPPKKSLEPIKWLRTINALNFFVPTQNSRSLSNLTGICIQKLLLYPHHTNNLLSAKRHLTFISKDNRTVRFG